MVNVPDSAFLPGPWAWILVSPRSGSQQLWAQHSEQLCLHIPGALILYFIWRSISCHLSPGVSFCVRASVSGYQPFKKILLMSSYRKIWRNTIAKWTLRLSCPKVKTICQCLFLLGARMSLIFAPLHICFILLMSANQGSLSPINMPLAEFDLPKMAAPTWGHHNLESQFSALNLISVPWFQIPMKHTLICHVLIMWSQPGPIRDPPLFTPSLELRNKREITFG